MSNKLYYGFFERDLVDLNGKYLKKYSVCNVVNFTSSQFVVRCNGNEYSFGADKESLFHYSGQCRPRQNDFNVPRESKGQQKTNADASNKKRNVQDIYKFTYRYDHDSRIKGFVNAMVFILGLSFIGAITASIICFVSASMNASMKNELVSIAIKLISGAIIIFPLCLTIVFKIAADSYDRKIIRNNLDDLKESIKKIENQIKSNSEKD